MQRQPNLRLHKTIFLLILFLLLSGTQTVYAKRVEVYDPVRGNISSGEIDEERKGTIYDPQEGYQIEIQINDDQGDKGEIYDPDTTDGNLKETEFHN
jgi:hypothetical protein